VSGVLAQGDAGSSAALLVAAVLAAAAIGFYVWVIVDLIRQPDWLWQRARLSKQFWRGLFVFGWLVGVGFPATVVYLAYVRPKLAKAKRSAERGEPWSASGRVTDPIA
jgi:hypothetical protein